MDNRKRTYSGSGTRRSAAGSRRNTDGTSGRAGGGKKKSAMTPGIAAVIAAVVTAAVCTPLVILAVQKTKESESVTAEERLMTAEEFGFTAVTPSPSALSVSDYVTEPSGEGEEPSASAQSTGKYLYETGMQDEKIKDIQQKLMDLGYMAEDETTDLYGPATTDAVELFQHKHGLNATGKIDQNTYDMMFSGDAVFYTAIVGDNGKDVAEIQSYLRKLGYFTGSSTGYFGTETEAAVKNFQQANGLSADGKVGIKTLSVLKSSNAVKYTAPPPSPSASASPAPSESAPADSPAA